VAAGSDGNRQRAAQEPREDMETNLVGLQLIQSNPEDIRTIFTFTDLLSF
jgi:hypothetical protein